MAEENQTNEKEQQRLRQTIEKLQTSNQRMYTETLSNIKEMRQQRGEEMGGVAQDILGSLENINEKNKDATKKEQRQSVKQIKQLQVMADQIEDPEQKREIQRLIEQSQNTAKKSANVIKTSMEGIGERFAGVSTTLVESISESPLLNSAISALSGKAQEKIQEKRQQRAELRQKLEKKQIDQGEKQYSAQQESNQKLNDVTNKLEKVNTNLSPLTEDQAERRREERRYNERLLGALQNTGGEGGSASATSASGTSMKGKIGGVFRSIKNMAMLGLGGLMTAFASKLPAFLARMVPKVLGKVIVPIAIVTSLFSGIMEAIKVYKETGSIKEAAIGFFGGIFDFITFGLFGTEELNATIDWIKEKFGPVISTIKDSMKYIWDSFTSLFNIDEIRNALSNLWEGSPQQKMVNHVTELFDIVWKKVESVFKSLKDFALDMVPDWVKDKLGIGADEDKKVTAQEGMDKINEIIKNAENNDLNATNVKGSLATVTKAMSNTNDPEERARLAEKAKKMREKLKDSDMFSALQYSDRFRNLWEEMGKQLKTPSGGNKSGSKIQRTEELEQRKQENDEAQKGKRSGTEVNSQNTVDASQNSHISLHPKPDSRKRDPTILATDGVMFSPMR